MATALDRDALVGQLVPEELEGLVRTAVAARALDQRAEGAVQAAHEIARSRSHLLRDERERNAIVARQRGEAIAVRFEHEAIEEDGLGVGRDDLLEEGGPGRRR